MSASVLKKLGLAVKREKTVPGTTTIVNLHRVAAAPTTQSKTII